MQKLQPAKGVPPEQTRMVKTWIDRSGLHQNLISGKSGQAAEAYGALYPELPKCLTESTLSRMKTGNGLQKLQRSNLVLLHLTVHWAKRWKQGVTAVSVQQVEAAVSFADEVLSAGGAPVRPGTDSYNPTDPRHHRTADSFGEYGVHLLGYAIARDDAESYRKLAVLQWLAGNTDDARHWSRCAGDAASGPPEALDDSIATKEAFVAGRQYLYNGKRAVAEIYLGLAADAGHAESAFMLGDVLEALQRTTEARAWFSRAQRNGHSEAGNRLHALAQAV